MQKLYYFLLILAVIGTISTSCKKDKDEDEEEEIASSGYFKATINGVLWEAADPVATYETNEHVSGYAIKDNSATAWSTTLWIEIVDLEDGTYGLLSANYIRDGNIADEVSDQDFSLNITTHDKTNKFMEGTFSFYLFDDAPDGISASVKSGSFGLNYK